ncbi:glycosyltransferase family 2 protein [Natranaerofaba carboxydovora]|uniref:glycosyltransferase family 2 protein n=1 Tax=Natranaerofaba carboxydovora TaxID=2742683 RepID=UPI001F13DCEF|nr:glycosyltransferase family 2 protein [Natranaerofaba carboxydovora]UMZ73937.1 UDP-Glc:alpha-D-GlcNAc-diphosphoundecaprenol beta-1,3-glucosyltransferase WfgD [Natranaerofaba carboxydovora]
MKDKFISVIIPAYNEGDLIYKTVSGAKSVPLINQVLVIDDGSSDNTSLEAKRAKAEILRIDSNKGKGNALNTGLQYATEDIIAFIDADLGVSSCELIELAGPVINNEVDISIAKFKKTNNSKGFGFVRFLASLCVYLITGKYISAPLSGQRVMTKLAATTIFPLEKDFGVEIDGTIKALKNKLTIKEVEVNMNHRKTTRDLDGFLHRVNQGYQIFKTVLLKHLLQRAEEKNVILNKHWN